MIEEKGLIQESSEDLLRSICEEVLRENPAEVEKYKAGKKGVLGFFVGQVIEKNSR